MRAGSSNGARPDPSGAAAGPDSVLNEVRAAADAALGHARKVAETAAAEARLSLASLAALAATAVAALAFVILTWISLVALGVWLAIQAGTPVWIALIGAVLVNLGGVFACRLWVTRLVSNLGFARTRRLLRAERTWPSAS